MNNVVTMLSIAQHSTMNSQYGRFQMQSTPASTANSTVGRALMLHAHATLAIAAVIAPHLCIVRSPSSRYAGAAPTKMMPTQVRNAMHSKPPFESMGGKNDAPSVAMSAGNSQSLSAR